MSEWKKIWKAETLEQMSSDGGKVLALLGIMGKSNRRALNKCHFCSFSCLLSPS